MNSQFTLDTFTPYSVGFDTLFDRLHKLKTPTTSTYPPYNIVKLDDNQYVIELALAGFKRENLTVEVKENLLTVSGKEKETNENYLYKGISHRAFTRTFTLADTVEVKSSELVDGMLRIYIENVIPEHKKPRIIEIDDLKPKKLK